MLSYIKNAHMDTTRHNCLKQTVTCSYHRIRTMKIETGESTWVSLGRFDIRRIGAKRLRVGCKTIELGMILFNWKQRKKKRKENPVRPPVVWESKLCFLCSFNHKWCTSFSGKLELLGWPWWLGRTLRDVEQRKKALLNKDDLIL